MQVGQSSNRRELAPLLTEDKLVDVEAGKVSNTGTATISRTSEAPSLKGRQVVQVNDGGKLVCVAVALIAVCSVVVGVMAQFVHVNDDSKTYHPWTPP